MTVNGHSVNPEDLTTWPDEWRQFHLVLRRSPMAREALVAAAREQAILLMAMILPLLPIEEVQASVESEVEGGQSRELVKRYERSQINRAACLARWGTTCRVCSIDFGQVYGPIGTGYIHVHHIVPVSQMGEGYRVNPLTELVPVCPNCHAMLHRRNPPFSVEELKNLMDIAAAERDHGKDRAEPAQP